LVKAEEHEPIRVFVLGEHRRALADRFEVIHAALESGATPRSEASELDEGSTADNREVDGSNPSGPTR
jgi:hypothetical protein